MTKTQMQHEMHFLQGPRILRFERSYRRQRTTDVARDRGGLQKPGSDLECAGVCHQLQVGSSHLQRGSLPGTHVSRLPPCWQLTAAFTAGAQRSLFGVVRELLRFLMPEGAPPVAFAAVNT
jgi:hypothetical protein